MYSELMTYNPVRIEISELRKRLRAVVEQRRRATAARRIEIDQANAAYEAFLKNKLTQLDGIASIESSFALSQVKYSIALPV